VRGVTVAGEALRAHEEGAPATAAGVRPGGVATEVLSDHSARLAPLTGAGADGLIRPVRAAPLLPGHRVAPAAGLTALSDTRLRVSRLADDLDFPVRSSEAAAAVTRQVQVAPHRLRRGAATWRRLRRPSFCFTR